MTPLFQFTPRGYLHFDTRISRAFAEQLATDPVAVSRHSFYPFIEHKIETVKIRKRQGGGVEKSAPKIRPIAYAAHKDSHIFSHYSDLLSARYEAVLKERRLENCVTAFRSIQGKCNIDFAHEVFEFIKVQDKCFVLASDIRDFFPSLQHSTLKNAIASLLNTRRLPDDYFAVFRAVTEYSLVDRGALYRAFGIDPDDPRAGGRTKICTPQQFRKTVRGGNLLHVNRTGKGIPQGSPISAILANIYMLAFDVKAQEFAMAHGGMYRRYCDDLLVVLPTEEARTRFRKMMDREMTNLALTLHPTKTEEIDFAVRDGRITASKVLNYLGFTFDGKHTRIRPGSIARYYKKMRAGVGRARAIRYRICKAIGNWTPLRRKKLHIHYSYLGRHNFISYAIKAAKIMNDKGIKRQVKKHWKRLQDNISGK